MEPLSGRWLRLTFGDGAVHEVDLTRLIAVGRVFAAIRDDQATVEAVRVDPVHAEKRGHTDVRIESFDENVVKAYKSLHPLSP